MSVIPIFGELADPIIIATDKLFYLEGERIKITGEVKDFHIGTPVTLIVTSPSGNLVGIDQLTINEDKTFSTELYTAGSSLMNRNGFYTISVVYGHESRSAETAFELKVESASVDTILFKGSNDELEYKITGDANNLLNIVPDVDASSLIVTIDTTSDGSLTLKMPRSIFDSVENGKDAEIFVYADDTELKFTETTTSKDRTLVIAFPAGTQTIEITGTFVIPEFGTIAAMILAVAIISIIAVSAKSRLSIIPRY